MITHDKPRPATEVSQMLQAVDNGWRDFAATRSIYRCRHQHVCVRLTISHSTAARLTVPLATRHGACRN